MTELMFTAEEYNELRNERDIAVGLHRGALTANEELNEQRRRDRDDIEGLNARVAELLAENTAVTAQFNHERAEAIAARRELAQFREQVIEEVIDHPGGCHDGKAAFLESIGLEWPTEQIEIVITVTRDRGDEDSIDRLEQELIDRVNRFPNLNCESVEWD